MTATIALPTAQRGATNERVERDTIPDGERVIYGQRVLGIVRLVDIPATGRGRRYIIERDLTVMVEVEAIVEDYLDQAARWQLIPAAGSCALAESAEELLASPTATAQTRLSVSSSPSRDLAIATLVGRYVERREHQETPCVHDLLAIAGEFGDAAVDEPRTVLAFYEVMRASEDVAH